MKIIIAITVLSILIFIVLVHIYWALGGKRWVNVALPKLESKENQPVFEPGILATLIVAGGLCLFALSILEIMTWVHISDWLIYVAFGAAIIFLLRAIGEFKYVGFFKRVKGSDFAKMDTILYSPLCLFLSLTIFSLLLI